jgi:HlyD family secretion protein
MAVLKYITFFYLWRVLVRINHYLPFFALIALLSALGYGVLRWWQGPQVQGYKIRAVPLVQTVVATGRIVSKSRSQIGSEITGVVVKRLVKEGDKVNIGDPLVVLRSDEMKAKLAQAEAELTELQTSLRPKAEITLKLAQFNLTQAQKETRRRKNLVERALFSIEKLEQAEQAEMSALSAFETARLHAQALAPDGVEEVKLRQQVAALKAQLAKTVISSQVSGTVLTRNVEPGDLVQPGRILFTIALDGITEIVVPFDERNLALLALNQKAMAVTDAYPNQPFSAKITYIAPSIDPQRGTVDVRLVVDPVSDFLRQDMTVSVNVGTGYREKSLAAPNDAMTNINNNSAQVLLYRQGKVQRHKITLGMRGLTMTEVLLGLNEGDYILANATAPLKDGKRVRFVQITMPQSSNVSVIDTHNELPVNFN